MLTISSQQWEIFTKHAIEVYINRMLQYISIEYPEYYYTHDQVDLRRFILDTIELAKKFCLTDEFTVNRFLDYRILLGASFLEMKENEWMVRILDDKDRLELKKINDIDRIQFGYTIAQP